MKLPNVDHARIERAKIVDYLLAVDHPEGAGKAIFFVRFGFAITNWETFADALIAHARLYQVTKMSESKFGAKYQIDSPLPCPDERSPVIRAVWIVDAGTDFPRLDHRLSLRMNAIMIREHFLASLKQRGLEIT